MYPLTTGALNGGFRKLQQLTTPDLPILETWVGVQQSAQPPGTTLNVNDSKI